MTVAFREYKRGVGGDMTSQEVEVRKTGVLGSQLYEQPSISWASVTCTKNGFSFAYDMNSHKLFLKWGGYLASIQPDFDGTGDLCHVFQK